LRSVNAGRETKRPSLGAQRAGDACRPLYEADGEAAYLQQGIYTKGVERVFVCCFAIVAEQVCDVKHALAIGEG
jgi:hypothetical protein